MKCARWFRDRCAHGSWTSLEFLPAVSAASLTAGHYFFTLAFCGRLGLLGSGRFGGFGWGWGEGDGSGEGANEDYQLPALVFG
jgi:hypothetical protein